ncbi:uncharacterized protein A4U43_C07F6850 [Asparagus officinalis]|uniref:TNase-like domain-containing protein n=1 Tax=Asparagus officinalis TaxID=4686 RepID=A0A5P1EF46_ASPOF|nr:uncharacterized protein A4U43_C07F6850 [Asparagus officinalis]
MDPKRIQTPTNLRAVRAFCHPSNLGIRSPTLLQSHTETHQSKPDTCTPPPEVSEDSPSLITKGEKERKKEKQEKQTREKFISKLMGNALLRFLCGNCSSDHSQAAYGHHGVTSATVGVSALAQDLLTFDATAQVPEGLSQHVVSSKKAQANWYKKLLGAWREANPPPRTAEEATALVVHTLKRHHKADVEGLLAFYGLPRPHTAEVQIQGTAPSKPQGVKYELHTLPVDLKAIADGDTITVYVDTAEPRESSAYRVINGPNGEGTLARKYRIRLRGIDAPESAMPYGKEAKEELVRLVQGKRLVVYVYGDDRYGRCVGDVHCDGTFVQEKMLKKGFAWHYSTYDQRPEFSQWENQARAARLGLWASSNPEKPWEWRKDRRNGA